MAKEAVREAASVRGWWATFMARPVEHHSGSGLHLHQTVADELFDGTTLTRVDRSFLGGQLRHARGVGPAMRAQIADSARRFDPTSDSTIYRPPARHDVGARSIPRPRVAS